MSISTTSTVSQTKLAQAVADSVSALALASASTTLTMTGDVSGSASGTTSLSPVLAIGPNKVTNSHLAQVATGVFKGRASILTGNVEDLTGTQATSLLDSFSVTAKGLVPAPGAASGKVLSDNGTWVVAAGGSGTVSTVSIVNANGLAGTIANPGTTPAITLTTSVTGLLKGNGTAISAAVAGTDFASAPLTAGIILDFGIGKEHLSATVSLLGVLASSLVVGSVSWDSSLNRSEEELAIDPLHLSFRAGANQVIVNATAALRTAVGKYKISIVTY